jgi:hypothetical protein
MKVEIVKDGIDAGQAGKARYRTVDADGAPMRVRVVDADSPNFAADFQAAFRANVRRIRRDSRALAVAAE